MGKTKSPMNEPRFQSDYTARQTTAAHRVLVDVGQELASFRECVVVVGGWVPDLLLPASAEEHVGSIDVDLALDADKLSDGRYAELLKLLLETRRYYQGEKPFQLYTLVRLADNHEPIRVDVDFLAPKEVELRSRRPKLIPGFRIQKADGCAAAFRAPKVVFVEGQMVSGATNRVELYVASLPDFLVMKSYALRGHDKPKDAYDICFCLDHSAQNTAAMTESWKSLRNEPDVKEATAILKEKFTTPESFDPQQVSAFYQSANPEERAIQAQRSYQLVQQFLAATMP